MTPGKRLRGGKPRQPIYAGLPGKIARAFDGLVGTFAPATAHGMRLSRMKTEALLAYEAARITPQNPDQPSGSSDAETLPDLPKLRDKSRALVRDDPHAASTMNVHEEGIVGEGIRPQAACTPRETGLSEDACREWNQAAQAAFDRWADDEADATGVESFYGLQGLALRCYLTDGDGIGHAIVPGDGTIRCEIIDADRVVSPGDRDTDAIRGGVELGAGGERLAFHILRHHPADIFLGAPYSVRPDRVPTFDNGFAIVQHVFKRTRAGQTRGVPLLTPAIIYQNNLHHYLDSELIAARAASNFAMFIRRNVGKSDPDLLPVQDEESPNGQSYIEELSPGIVEYLNEGEEPVAFTPNRPGTAFASFVERILRATAASSGLSYEVVCRDFGRMNLSSARAMLREIAKGFRLQARRLVRSFCRPWWHNVVRMEIASGRLRPPAGWRENPLAFLRADWVSPTFGMVDPEGDTKGSNLQVDANLSDQFTEAQARGRDAEDVLRKRARFYRMALDVEKEHGLDPGTLTKERPERIETMQPVVPGKAPGAPGAPAAPDDPVDEEPQDGADGEGDAGDQTTEPEDGNQ